MQKIRNIVQDILDGFGWRQSNLAEELEVSQSSIHRWLSGVEPRAAIYDQLLELKARADNNRRKKNQTLSSGKSVSNSEGFGRGGWHGDIKGSIPELDIAAGAGEGTIGEMVVLPVGNEAISAHKVIDEWLLSQSFLRHELKASVRQSIIVEVVGDSMEPTYFPGDRIIVDLSQNLLIADTVYLISDGFDAPQIKRLQRIPFSDPPEVNIISDNSALENFKAPLENVRIHGRVCGHISRK